MYSNLAAQLVGVAIPPVLWTAIETEHDWAAACRQARVFPRPFGPLPLALRADGGGGEAPRWGEEVFSFLVETFFLEGADASRWCGCCAFDLLPLLRSGAGAGGASRWVGELPSLWAEALLEGVRALDCVWRVAPGCAVGLDRLGGGVPGGDAVAGWAATAAVVVGRRLRLLPCR